MVDPRSKTSTSPAPPDTRPREPDRTSDAAKATPSAYRADIDGLRAIAVLSVVAYHAFPSGLRGGYIGVDIFFVISGFLISGILFRTLSTNTFSIRDFYARRVKRIFPSLLAVLSCSLLFGWFVLLPDEFEQLSKHIIGGAGFSSNLVLWRESGYFDVSADRKPLLHLWSLGIEEQFYLVWPLLLFLVWNRKALRLPAILLLTALSFTANVLFVRAHPSATFYLPISRFWELLAGGGLAFGQLAAKNAPRMARRLFERLAGHPSLLAVFGAFLYVLALFELDTTSAFPGWWALLPTLGAGLVIAAGEGAWLNRTLLSHPILVWFGLISYPLYLWHWPLLAFTRILQPGKPELDISLRLFLVAGATLLAWMTHVIVEQPVRHARRTGLAVTALSAAMVLTAAGALVVYRANGVPDRAAMRWGNGSLASKLSDLAPLPVAGYFKCDPAFSQAEPALGYCMSSTGQDPALAIVGDSHADHLFHGIATHDTDHNWLLIGHPSCPPVLGISVVFAGQTDCDRKMEKAFARVISSPHLHTVVLSFFGSYFESTAVAADHVRSGKGPESVVISSTEFAPASKIELFYLGLERAVATLELAGKTVVIVADIPELPFFPRDCLDRPYALGKKSDCVLSTEMAIQRRAQHLKQLGRIAKSHPGVRVFDPLSVLCPGSVCEIDRQGVLMYRDSHHLSARGSEAVGSSFLTWFYRLPPRD